MASLAIAVFLSFNATTLAGFATSSIIQAILITSFCVLAYRTVKDFNSLGLKKIGLKVVLLALLLLGITFMYLANSLTGVITGVGIPHLRTNILTGECGLNKYTDQIDFWYFERGCDLPDTAKIAIIKQNERARSICRAPRGSVEEGYYWDGLTCEDVLK